MVVTHLFFFMRPSDDKDRIELRSLCRLFRDALKPLPRWTRWTSFPHPSFSTLNGLMNTLNEMYAALPGIVWEVPTALEALVVGMKVRAKFVGWRGGTSFKDATIQKVNEDDTFDIIFGNVCSIQSRKNVPLNEIQIPIVSHSFSLSFFPCFVRCFAHIISSSFLFFFFFLLFSFPYYI